MKTVLLAFVFCYIFFPLSYAGGRCEAAFQTQKSPVDYVRKVPGDFVTFMRSNPAWSWAWFESRISTSSTVFKEWSQYSGVVGGDIKPDNVDLVLREDKKPKIGIIDVDDGGQGRLLGDLFHSLVYNEVWPISLPSKELLDMYEWGLKGEKQNYVEDLLKKIADSKEDLAGSTLKQKKLEKMVQDESYFLSELKLVPIEKASPEVQKLYADSFSSFQGSLQKLGNLIHKGLRIKESGGSMGLPRFTFLVQTTSGKYRVVEMKFQAEPAVSAANNQQLPTAQRVASLIQSYRPDGDPGSIKEVLVTKSGAFIIREKVGATIDGGSIPDKSELREIYKDYVRSVFWWLGQKHSEQNKDYAQTWKTFRNQGEAELLKTVQDHVRDSQTLYQ